MAGWWQTRVRIPASIAEAAAWLIAEALDHPVELQDQTTMASTDSSETILLVIGFNEEPDEKLATVLGETMTQLGYTGLLHPETRRRDDDTWRDGWKAFFKGVQLSQRIWAGPPWEPPPPHSKCVFIEPGMAFGIGTHPTTSGAMKMLDSLLTSPPRHLLDVGCGSGILSIAAAKLGHRATGCEIDPVAVKNAQTNIELNEVSSQVDVLVGSADDVAGQFDLVVANIIAPVLIDIAGAISNRATDQLILSGLLAEQERQVLAAYPDFRVRERTQDGSWVVLLLEAL